MRISPLDFSQARTAPESVVRGLEELDPSACIVHLGGTRWLVGKVRPNALVRRDAEAMFENWHTNVRAGKRMSANGMQRVRLAMLAMLGVRPVQQYRIIGEPDGRIVKDFQESRFRWLTTSDAQFERQLEAPDIERREAARKELADLDRAKDAHRYAFSRSHMPSASLTPVVPVRSGFTRVATI